MRAGIEGSRPFAPAGGIARAALARDAGGGLAANDSGAGNGFQASGRLEGDVGYGLPPSTALISNAAAISARV